MVEIEAGMDPKKIYIIHFDEKIRYVTDDKEIAKITYNQYIKNSELPWKITTLYEWAKYIKSLEE